MQRPSRELLVHIRMVVDQLSGVDIDSILLAEIDALNEEIKQLKEFPAVSVNVDGDPT